METIIQYLIEAFKAVIDSVDYVYLIMYMLTSYILLKGFDFKMKARYQVLIVGVAYAAFFGICKMFWWLPYHNVTRQMPYAYVLFFSFILGQFLNLYGIIKLIEIIINAAGSVFQAGLAKFKKS